MSSLIGNNVFKVRYYSNITVGFANLNLISFRYMKVNTLSVS